MLVEPARVSSIGVGEATFSTIKHFFDYLGLAEREWMPQCSDSYKIRIRFESWRRDGCCFYHPFERPRNIGGFSLTEWWLLVGDHASSFDRKCFIAAVLCDAKRSPRMLDGSLFDAGLDNSLGWSTLTEQRVQSPYAYHFNADMIAGFLANHRIRRRVCHGRDDVVSVALKQRGWISHPRTASTADWPPLFVECTSFQDMLINQALGEPFKSLQGMVSNNRTVTRWVPARTRSRSSRTRRPPRWMPGGCGRSRCSGWTATDTCTPTSSARRRRWSGRSERRLPPARTTWKLTISGYGWDIPLIPGSTASRSACQALSSSRWSGPASFSSNTALSNCSGTSGRTLGSRAYRVVDGVKEFRVLHYRAVRRNDTPYWKEAKISDSLLDRLGFVGSHLLDERRTYSYYHGSESYSWNTMLVGLEHGSARPRRALTRISQDSVVKEFTRLRNGAGQLAVRLPSCYDYLPTPMLGRALPSVR
jgi:tryptophan 5-halogenase